MDSPATSPVALADDWNKLMEKAAAFDAGKLDEAPAESPKQEVPSQDASAPKDASKPADKPAEPEKVDQSKSDKSSLNNDSKSETDKPESKAKETPEDEPKSKWKQNEERKAKTWEQINAEKETFRKERENFLREKEEFEKARVAKSAEQEYRDDRGFTAKDYAEAAKTFAEKGDKDLAEAAQKRAAELQQKETQYRQELAVKSIQDSWAKSYNEAVSRLPDLKDTNSDIHKEVLATLNRYPELKSAPRGLEAAIERAEAVVKARSVESKESEIKQLREKLTALEKKLSIGPGAPDAKLDAPKKFDELDRSEQFKRLEQKFREMDGE